MTKSYIVNPKTGELLTAQEWKETAGGNVNCAQMVAIVPDDGSPAFAMPVETFERMNWRDAMKFAGEYKAPHEVKGSDGVFSLPSRKQAIDIRAARENGLEQLLGLIGADGLLSELHSRYGWTRENYRPSGLAEGEDYDSSTAAWLYYRYGMSSSYGMSNYQCTVRPVTLLKP